MMMIDPKTKALLSRTLREKTPSASTLFTGMRGAFLRETAIFFAQSLQCHSREADPCGTCKSCQSFHHKDRIDFLDIHTETTHKIDTVRQIIEAVKYGPSERNFYIVLINQAEKLSTQAGNALLKTLEEPPKNVCFIFTSHSKSAVLPTIRSRSQEVKCPKLPHHQLETKHAHLSEALQKKIAPIIAKSPQALSFILDLENCEAHLENYIPFENVQALSLFEKLSLAETLAKSKPHYLTIASLWQYEIDPSSRDGKLIIENILNMTYNLNIRLHIEAFMMQIHQVEST